ncbi:MAG: hypothetical protein C0392_07655 [Syntrophus sp. (in: bacteria)]|nr:hypothetical protein [Syntrophus sp. (in: bacteria)]
MPETIYWFGFRQTVPRPPAKAVPCGPYDSREKANRERESSKAWDCNVSTVFIAETREEAEKKAEELTP